MFIHRLLSALEDEKIAHALVGGYAVALHGAVRGTVDIDLVIKLSKKDFLAIEQTLKNIGLESRLPITATQVYDFREEYIKNRNLIAWSFYNPKKPIECVDILLTENLSKIKIDRIQSGNAVFKVASVNDLIRMKTLAGRPQDLIDVAALKALKK